ncbi:MAG: hypothetical protein WAT39_10175 [Planctomycetota bacterium]
MFFLLLLVMFLGALGFAYVTQTKNGELTKQRNEAMADNQTLRQRDLLIEHYIGDVGNVVQKPGKYEGRDNQGGVYGAAVLAYPGVMNPKEVKKALDDALAGAQLSAASGLDNVLGSLVTRVNQLNQRVKDVEAERDKALDEKNEVDRKFTAATADAQAKAREFGTNLDQARSDFEQAKTEKEGRIQQVTQSLQAKQDELTTEKERATAKEKDLNHEIAKRDMMNSALVARDALKKPADVPDGKIVVARNGIPTAFINLGRKDMLQPNTVFRVRSPGSDKVKGMATVTRVEEEKAEVALSDFVDPIGDFARAGDLLYNDLFTPRVTRTIYLMGRFTAPYNKPELTNLLKRLGNKVVDKMAPGVDTVILGNDPVNEAGDGFASVQESAEFKMASELRVEFAYLSTIRDLIKL